MTTKCITRFNDFPAPSQSLGAENVRGFSAIPAIGNAGKPLLFEPESNAFDPELDTPRKWGAGFFVDPDTGDDVQISWIGTLREAQAYYQRTAGEWTAKWEAENNRPAVPHFVYVIADPDRRAVKIGIAKNAQTRLKAVQTGNGGRLHICRLFEVHAPRRARAVEKEAHHILNGERLAGEWFGVTPKRAEQAIKDAAARKDVPIFPLVIPLVKIGGGS